MKPVFFRMAIDSAAHLIQLVSASAHLFLMSRGGCISLWSKAPVSWNFLLDLLSASGIRRWVSPDLQGGTQRYEQKTQALGCAIGVQPDPEMLLTALVRLATGVGPFISDNLAFRQQYLRLCNQCGRRLGL